jgi:hypothetical protein
MGYGYAISLYDGQYNLSGSYETDLAGISSLNLYYYTTSATTGYLYGSLSSDTAVKPQETMKAAQIMNYSVGNKLYTQSLVSTYYDRNGSDGGGKGEAPMGDTPATIIPALPADWWAESSFSLSFSNDGISYLYGKADLFPWSYTSDGVLHNITSFSPNWTITFKSVAAAAEFSEAMAAEGVTVQDNTSVPEPTSLAFVGLGAIGLLTRRRR